MSSRHDFRAWAMGNSLPIVAGILVALTVYHIIGYYTVFQHR